MERLEKHIKGVVEIALEQKKGEKEITTMRVVVNHVDVGNRKVFIYHPFVDGRLIKLTEEELKAVIVGDKECGKCFRYDIFGMRIFSQNMLSIIDMDVGEGYEFNRRKAYRVSVEGNVEVSQNNKDWITYNMVDISQDGIALTGLGGFELGSKIRIKHYVEGAEVFLEGQVKREVGVGAGLQLVGIQYLEQNRDLTRFIYQQQKVELQKRKELGDKENKWSK